MKRKYFSALLMGALTIASVSTFTSCKDYDDDISSLQSQIDKLNEMVSKIQGQIDKGAILTSVSPVENGVKLTLSNGDSYTITNGKDGAKGADGAAGAPGTPGKDADIWKIGDDGYWYKNETKTDYKAVGTDGAAGAAGTAGTPGAPGKDGKYYVPNPQTGTFFVYGDGDKDAYDSGISYTSANVLTAIWSEDALVLNNVKDVEGGKVVINLTSKLLSLVFSPKAYWEGIETIPVYSFDYNPIELEKADVTKNQIGDLGTENSGKHVSIVTDAVASYYLNPSNASVDTKDVSHYSFLINTADILNTRASSNDIKVTKVDKEDGMIKVHFGMANGNALTETNNKVDVAALRYKYAIKKGDKEVKDTLVTSDFAALKHFKITSFSINKVAAKGTVDEQNASCQTLATTAESAVKDVHAPVLSIAYNDVDGIHLDDWMDVHYKVNNQYALWGGQTTINEQKFKLKYELIGYISPNYDTNESDHATIEGDLFKVKGYKDDATGRQIIGRTPLVRVTLVDGNSGDAVASVGYIKVEITDVNATPETVESDGIKKDYTVGCTGNALDKVQAITWDEVESKVLAKIDMSKSEFEANYRFVDGIQYKSNAQNGFDVLTPSVGTVVSTTDAVGGHQTNVLKWTVTENEAYQLLKKDGDVITVWVKFAPKSTARALKDIYVKLSWTAPKVHNTPTATIKDSDKKAAAWHKANTNAAGFDQLHIQVGNATQAGATCEFDNLVVANTFNSSLVSIVKKQIENQYAALAGAATVKYKFAPTADQSHKTFYGAKSNTEYKISVNTDGTKLSASDGTNSHVLATITEGNGTISIEKNDFTKDILNKYGSVSELADALTFTVLADVKTCDPASDLINLTNKTFDVKVIKPLFVKSVSVAAMTLNNYQSMTNVPVKFEFVDFNNYTQAKFWANSNPKVAFKDFYKITSIQKYGDITTNYSGNWKKIDESDIKVTYTPATLAVSSGVISDYGKVSLVQVNQSRANGFDVKIPVAITYNWGTLYTDIQFHVNPASAAARKH
ncbi:PL29 family lyase N-terminal domain-containing protein [Segatella copri]|uniref:PL29 family lyase N-terminal domain-containing protein n=1 Tax=Segatella copri TaxID=165179 RepID=UPI00294B5350|nr:PL29 family lyase N-terminal domain-containing protein [Segatella copri]WOG03296.1 PL29 family lyase N-terminal domain-containing protein [Segatella copri]